MGCRNACICSGRCSESCYEAEKYCVEAEDIKAIVEDSEVYVLFYWEVTV